MAAIKNNAERLTRLIMDWLHSRKAQVVLITITIAWFSYSEPAHTITGPPHSMSRCLLCNIVNNIEPDEPIWVFWSSWCRFVHFFFFIWWEGGPVHTVTAVTLSLDFSDDAMVKRGVTKSILKEFCKEMRVLSTSCRITVSCVFEDVDLKAHLFQSVSPDSPSPRILQVPETGKIKIRYVYCWEGVGHHHPTNFNI